MNIGVLASGEGSTLQAIIDGCKSKKITGQVTVVISNKKEAKALSRAISSNIPAICISPEKYPNPGDYDTAILNELINHNVELVVLAGYLKKIGTEIISKYKNKIINTHPALLPKYGGKGMHGINIHKAVIAAREKESGISIHIVDKEYDTGLLIAQHRVKVEPNDTAETLAQRVHSHELEFIVATLSKITSGELKL